MLLALAMCFVYLPSCKQGREITQPSASLLSASWIRTWDGLKEEKYMLLNIIFKNSAFFKLTRKGYENVSVTCCIFPVGIQTFQWLPGLPPTPTLLFHFCQFMFAKAGGGRENKKKWVTKKKRGRERERQRRGMRAIETLNWKKMGDMLLYCCLSGRQRRSRTKILTRARVCVCGVVCMCVCVSPL